MNRQEKTVLLGLALLIVAGGVVTSLFGNSDQPVDDAQQLVRRGLAFTGNVDVPDPDNSWTCPVWSIKAVGGDLLSPIHSLYRRPAFIGQNRHKIMSEGWAGWFYNPPSEDYF